MPVFGKAINQMFEEFTSLFFDDDDDDDSFINE